MPRAAADMGPREDERRLRHQVGVLTASAEELEPGCPCPRCGNVTVHFRGDPPGRDWCTLCDWDPPPEED